MKTFCYQVKSWHSGFCIVQFWSKPDKSNAIEEKFVRLDGEMVRKRIELVTGVKKFRLEFVKK